jgi:hypothetical protein
MSELSLALRAFLRPRAHSGFRSRTAAALGRPNDAALQREVILSALSLLVREDLPVFVHGG